MNPDVPAHNAIRHGLPDKPTAAFPRAERARYVPDRIQAIPGKAIRHDSGRPLSRPMAPAHFPTWPSLETRNQLNQQPIHRVSMPPRRPLQGAPPRRHHLSDLLRRYLNSLGCLLVSLGAAAGAMTRARRLLPRLRRAPSTIWPTGNVFHASNSRSTMRLSVIASAVDSISAAKGFSLSPLDSRDHEKTSRLNREAGKSIDRFAAPIPSMPQLCH